MPNNKRTSAISSLKIGDIYMIDFNGIGSEQSGYRPALVIQNNTGNVYSPNVIVLPITSSIKKTNQPTHVLISSENSGLLKDSMVLCENPECVSKNRLNKYITSLNNEYMAKVAMAYLLATSVISFVTPELFITLQGKANDLNYINGYNKNEDYNA